MYKARLNFWHNGKHCKQGEAWIHEDASLLVDKGLLEVSELPLEDEPIQMAEPEVDVDAPQKPKRKKKGQ
jgi:hypothetical protein